MLENEIKNGTLFLDADRNDRFACMVGTSELKLNFITSCGPNRIRIGRAFYIENDIGRTEDRILTKRQGDFITPNYELRSYRFHLLKISKFTNSNEGDISFRVKNMTVCKDSIWRPDIISDRPDIFIESVELEVETEKGVL